jgi:hypothetical protein
MSRQQYRQYGGRDALMISQRHGVPYRQFNVGFWGDTSAGRPSTIFLMSAARQHVTRGESLGLIGCGNLPSFTPAHQLDREIGMNCRI